jgi:chromosome segregation ATPase
MSAFFGEKLNDSSLTPSDGLLDGSVDTVETAAELEDSANAVKRTRLPEAFYGLEAVITAGRKLEKELLEERSRIASLQQAYHSEKKSLQEQLRETASRSEKLTHELEKLKKDRANERSAVVKLEAESKSVKELLQQSQQENARLSREQADEKRRHEAELSQLSKERQQLSGEMVALKQQQQRLETDLNRVNQERARVEAELSHLNLERQRLQCELSETRSILSNEQTRAQAQLRKLHEEKLELQTFYATALERHKGLIREFEVTAQKNRDRIEAQELRHQELNRKFEAVRLESDAARAKLESERSVMREAESRLNQAKKEWGDKYKEQLDRVTQLKKELAEAESLNRALEESVRQLNERIEWAESEGFYAESRQAMERMELENRRLASQLDLERKQTVRYQNENSELLKYCEKIRLAAKETEAKLLELEPELEAARERLR